MKPIKDRSASTIAKLLYKVICQHGCMKTQGREFVNEFSKVLHNMIGTEQRITSEYHVSLCKRQKWALQTTE